MPVSGLVASGNLVIPPHLLQAGTWRATLTFCFYTCEKTNRITRNTKNLCLACKRLLNANEMEPAEQLRVCLL